jgi:hypothetical protein
VWIAAMSELALAMVARQADGWEASYLSPGEFAERWRRLRRLLAAERRDPESLRRSIEVDVVLGQTPPTPLARSVLCCSRYRLTPCPGGPGTYWGRDGGAGGRMAPRPRAGADP